MCDNKSIVTGRHCALELYVMIGIYTSSSARKGIGATYLNE